jgi:histidinol-phosphatase (PHP family)
MIEAAIKIGCNSLGFSEHSHVECDPIYSMTEETTRKYVKEINRLKEKFAGQVEIFLGLERDYYSENETDIDFDYIIGAVHNFEKDGLFVCVDNGAESQRASVNKYCGGDFYSFAEQYFAVVADVANKTKADIIAHFDLVSKYNSGSRNFDENHPRYISAALDAMDEIMKKCRLFEVNTGAMYRLGKTEPYPSIFFLKELKKRGGEVIITSDSHSAESLCHEFENMKQLLISCGFKYEKRLTATGFVDVTL